MGYEGVDEYTPLGADPAVIDKDAPNVTVNGAATVLIPVHIHIDRWDAESRMFTADMPAPGRLALRLFQYPAWRVAVNGHVVEASVRPGTGQMLVPVEAGLNRVQINFVRTWDRTVGGWISLIAAIGMIVWFFAGLGSASDIGPQTSAIWG